MTGTKRIVIVNVACAALVLVVLASAVVSALGARGDGTGVEWLSWSPSERSAFMNGFVTGYLRGTSKACNAADDLFEVNNPHSVSDRPSEKCHGRVDLYSKDSDAYTTVLTEFYTKHPEYRGIPSAYLLSFLSDSQYRTADQLYQMAVKGEMRTHF